MKNLIQKIASYYGYEFKKKTSKAKPVTISSAKFLTELKEKGKFTNCGIHELDYCIIHTVANNDFMLWIQIDKESGELMKVYKEVNENNLTILLNKIVNDKPFNELIQVKINSILSKINGYQASEHSNTTIIDISVLKDIDTQLREISKLTNRIGD